MQHHGRVPDEAVVLDDASFEMNDVADHTVVSDRCVIHGGGVKHRVVLDAGAITDQDRTIIAP